MTRISTPLLLVLLLTPLIGLGQRPILGLPYGHTGTVHSLSFSSDGSRLLSASADGTLKIWDVATGKFLQSSQETNQAVYGARLSSTGDYATYTWSYFEAMSRVWDIRADTQINLSSYGLTTLSPDGRWGIDFENKLVSYPGLEKQSLPPDVQASGFTPDGKSFYQVLPGQLQLYDLVSRKLTRTIAMEGLEESIYFSSNGQFVTDFNQNTWRFSDGKAQPTPEIPGDHNIQDISADGKYLLITIDGGNSKLFDLDQQQVVKTYQAPAASDAPGMGMMMGGPSGLVGAALSPDGQTVAWSSGDGTIILYDRESTRPLRKLQAHTPGAGFTFPASDQRSLVCLSADGRLHYWDFVTGRMSRSKVTGSLKETDLANPTNGKFFATVEDQQRAAANAKIHLLSTFGEAPLALRDEIYIKAVSPDRSVGASWETTIEYENSTADSWGTPITKLSVSVWDLNSQEALRQWENIRVEKFSPGLGIFSPDKKFLLLGENDYFTKKKVSSRLLDLESGALIQNFPETDYDATTTLAFSPDGKYVISGTYEGMVNLFDVASGKRLHVFQGHTGAVNTVTFSADGQKIFSSSGDGTIRVWDVTGKKELISLVHVDQEDWLVLSPDGLFDASQNAMSLLYYLVENGDQTDIVELEQLKARYYEPGLLQKVMGYSEERTRSVAGLDQVALYPEVNAGIEGDQLNIQLKARGGGIGQVSIFANGKEIVNDANPQRKTTIAYDLKSTQQYLFRHPDSTNVISLRVFNEAGWLKSSAINLNYQPSSWSKGSGSGGNSGWTGKLDPKMFVVSLGTSDYSGTNLDLQYATQDATSMALALQSIGSNLFSGGEGIEVYCLTTASSDSTGLEGTPVQWQYASKENLQSVLTGIKQKAKAEDVLLVYLSGHGVTHGGAEQSQFYYLTASVAGEEMINDADVRKKYTISSGELTQWINDIPALKQVLVIDACNSGKVVENLTGGTRNLNSSQIRALDRMQDRTGMFILSGSAADKVSYEASEYGQGLLTYSLLQGMLGVATRKTADGDYVDVMKLFQYARDEVPRLAATINGIQTPMLGFPKAGASFDIGIFDQSTKIPIGNKKPVVIRPNFLNQATLKDDLGLVKLLEMEFREETEKGKDANLIYVDVTDYPGSYSLSGLYTKDGDNITLTVKLFENGQNARDLEIPPTADPKRLVKLILREVKQLLALD